MPFPRDWLCCQTSSRPAGSCTEGGRNNKASTKLKIVTLAPMPSAREHTATAVNARFFASVRKA